MSVIVQVFARAPVPGQAKTRLMPALGPAGAAALHARMTRETVAGATRSGADAVEIWHTPTADPASTTFLDELAAARGAALRVQCGDDLGARMAHALADAARRGHASLLVGCDSPGQARGGMVEAVAALRGGARWLFRPALDGGYVCIGAGGMDADTIADAPIFADMRWGTEVVMAETRRRLGDAGEAWTELEAMADVDEPGDLVHVPASWLPMA